MVMMVAMGGFAEADLVEKAGKQLVNLSGK